MNDIQLSQKGKELIEFYKQMANGFERMDEHGNISKVEKEEAYTLFNISMFKNCSSNFKQNKIKTVLDYGCGGSDWDKKGFADTNLNAIEYFDLAKFINMSQQRNK